MYLKTLQLFNFKNYDEVRLEFSDKVNVLVGPNGSGKTNLLDAVYYLSLTKSAFVQVDAQLIRHSQKMFSVKGQFVKNELGTDILCAIQPGSKKTVREGANDYQKISDHIGRYPVVLIAPDDNELITEGSESRRRFFDTIISQIDKQYLEALIQYNHVLKQRNGILKLFAEGKPFDKLVLESYDRILVPAGEMIFKKRADFMREFIPIFYQYYQSIVGMQEKVGIEYRSELLSVDYASGLKASMEKDLVLQRTNFGVHRDDFDFTIDIGELKRLGSQGQKKSFVLSLKLAQFEILEKYTGSTPILLLDDIFDKLDDHRINKLLEMVGNGRFGQIFITDARPERTITLMDEIGVDALIFTIENGQITQE